MPRRITQQPPTDDDVNAVAKELYCPVCENTPLDVCPTQACEEWRQLIYDKLALGWNEEQVKIYFVDQYGDRVLAEPPSARFKLAGLHHPPIGISWLGFLWFTGRCEPGRNPLSQIKRTYQEIQKTMNTSNAWKMN